VKFLCGALGLLMLVPARMPACAQGRSEGLGGVAGLKVESYLQLRYTNDTAMGDYGSLRRAKAMITWDPGARLRMYGQLLYKSGNRATNDGRAGTLPAKRTALRACRRERLCGCSTSLPPLQQHREVVVGCSQL